MATTETGTPRHGRLERGIARLLVAAIVALTPTTGRAGDELPQAEQLVLETAGSVDNSQAGLTVIDSLESQGRGVWEGGLNQPADSTIRFDQPDADSSFLNIVDGDFGAHLNGTIISNGTVGFSSPFGVFIDGDAVIDVGGLVAIGANLADPARFDADYGRLDLEGDVTIAAGAQVSVMAADGDILLYGRNVTNEGTLSLGTGELLMLAGESIHFEDADSIADALIDPVGLGAILRGGTVTNRGSIEAGSARLFGRRVENHGEIRVRDGALMMMGADAIYLSEVDNPVLLRLPHVAEPATPDDPTYAVENHGTLDAGLGHVRLAASDPLGWGVRQGTGSAAQPASVAGGRVEIEGGEDGRVHLAGTVDARDRGAPSTATSGAVGGIVEVSGDVIALAGATIDASGEAGGGTIHVGGEQQGKGELQRARAVVIDEGTRLAADATGDGDGGRVIVFAEDLASIRGEISARGGDEGGDGGFVETSGLVRLDLTTTPDLSASAGEAGDWLIDPFNIAIVDTPPDEPGNPGTPDPLFRCEPGASCLNRAIAAILDPNADDAAFDGILRASGPADATGVLGNNTVDVELLARALSVGTNVTLSTEAFNTNVASPAECDADPATCTNDTTTNGNITFDADLLFDNSDVLPGTRATLTLLAARNIVIDGQIQAGSGTPSNLALSLVFRANDLAQRPANFTYGIDLLRGSVFLNQDIDTGGGSVEASGIAVTQAAGTSISTRGGDVVFLSGSLDADQQPVLFGRTTGVPFEAGNAPGITIEGDIDTTRYPGDPGRGGDILLTANGIRVETFVEGDNIFETEAGKLTLMGANLASDGGEIELVSGTVFNDFAGEVEINGATVDSSRTNPTDGELLGGEITIEANRVLSGLLASAATEGAITVTGSTLRTGGRRLTIGSGEAQSISVLSSTIDTQQLFGATGATVDPGVDDENGLVAIVAQDLVGINAEAGIFGDGQITLDTATIRSAGITLDARTITDLGSSLLEARGDSGEAILESELGIDSDLENLEDLALASPGEILLRADRKISLEVGTSLTADAVAIRSGLAPSELNGIGENPPTERTASDRATRLSFAGTGGSVASAGVRINANDVTIQIGDGATPTEDLAPPADDDPVNDPSATTLAREAVGDYQGLQIRDFAGSDRPDTLSIEQDGDLALVDAATLLGQLDFGAGGVFDNAAIGAEGLRTAIESSDGVLLVETAEGLNRTNLGTTCQTGDGCSWVRLGGGLLLNDAMGMPPSQDSIQFAGVLPVAFDVDALTLSTPRDLTITEDQAGTVNVMSLGAVDELTFEAGRSIGIPAATGEGTLTVDAGVTEIAARHALTLHAGASGFGDLVFAPSSGTRTLRADEITLRAGGGLGSENDGSSVASSRIVGVRDDVAFRNAMGGDFQGPIAVPPLDPIDTSDRAVFTFRQDATIDAGTDLPEIAQFFAAPTGPYDFANQTRYAIHSDFGAIDLLGEDGSRFQGAALSLVGLLAPLVDATGFDFGGVELELGGTADLDVGFALADALGFAGGSVNAKDYERLTLRAATNGIGTLTFSEPVELKAWHIDLIAGDGPGGSAVATIDPGSATFDLSGDPTGQRTLVFQEDGSIFGDANFISRDRFSGGNLATRLAYRSDDGVIDFVNFDLNTLPVTADGQLVLEARSIDLAATAGQDLVLTDETNFPDLAVRLRTDSLDLIATTDGTDSGAVLAGPPASGTPPSSGMDMVFDDVPLLIEAFDAETDSVSLTNLSEPSRSTADPTMFDLVAGRGPATISISQAAAIDSGNFPDRLAISGQLGRSETNALLGLDVATRITLTSTGDNGVENVIDLSDFELGALTIGSAFAPIFDDIRFVSATATLDDLFASTEGSILLEGGAITATNGIQLLAEQSIDTLLPPTDPAGALRFGAATTLTAREIGLFAGPEFLVTDEDGTELLPTDLPSVDLTNLTLATPLVSGAGAFGNDGSRFTIRQSAALSLDSATLAGVLGGGWENVGFTSIQGPLILNDAGTSLSTVAESLTLRQSLDDDPLVFQTDADDPFGGYAGPVRFEGDDVQIEDLDTANSVLGLDGLNLQIVGRDVFFTGGTPVGVGDLRRDQDETLQRPIFRVVRPGDFTGVRLPRADRYRRTENDFFGTLSEVARPSLSEIDIELTSTSGDLTFGDTLRDGVSFANLILRSTAGDVIFDLDTFTPGYATIDGTTLLIDDTDSISAALQLSSLDIEANVIRALDFDGTADDELSISTRIGDQRFDGDLVLDETLTTLGGGFEFTGDIDGPEGLILGARELVLFAGDIGTGGGGPLSSLYVVFERIQGSTPRVQFGSLTEASDQTVRVDGDIVFLTTPLTAPDDPTNPDDENRLSNLRAAIEAAVSVSALGDALVAFDVGRIEPAQFATIGKGQGNLTFEGASGPNDHFVMGSGERISVGGNLVIDRGGDGVVVLGDASALDITVDSREIGLVRRNAWVTLDPLGRSSKDGGSVIIANTIDFGGVTPIDFGIGKKARFAVQNPFAPDLPAAFRDFPLFAATDNDRLLVANDFIFQAGFPAAVPSLLPRGASRSDLTGAFGPLHVPLPYRENRAPAPPANPERLRELDVEARETEAVSQRDRVEGAAIIDDLGLAPVEGRVVVSEARLDAEDAEAAIALYEKLFGAEGERSGEVRAVLQSALDDYLETTRARRVIGFELRRFVKNRPSTLLEAYRTLDDLDALFRYHRRLGLSPGEYRSVQQRWLADIKPDGITLDELSEAIHPSRYVRGSDILDIFGR